MKTRFQFNRLPGAALLLALFFALLASSARAQTTNVSPGAFIEPLQGFITIDTAVEPVSGQTFILGRDESNHALMKKYNSAGIQIPWGNTTNKDITLTTGITPAAMYVVPNSTNIYIVGGYQVLRVSTVDGSVQNALSANNGGLNLSGVYSWNGQVFVSGSWSGGSATIFGKNANPRGAYAGILIKLTSTLSGTATSLITFGDTAGSSQNTADSVVVDDSGDVYVSGHLGTGTFASDVASSQSFNILYAHQTAGINNLSDAASVVGGNATSSTGYTVANLGGFGTTSDNGDHNYIIRATGLIYVPTAGPVTFTSTTDDGSWLYVDGTYQNGTQVIYDNTTHGSLAFSGTVHLFSGLHSIDWLYFNSGGPGNGNLAVSGGGLSGAATAADFTAHQNKGYVFKFSNNLGALENVYFTELSAGTGGRIYQLRYSQGWVYGIGQWAGLANNLGLSAPDNSSGGSENVEVLKLDTGLQLIGRATAKGAADNSGYGLTVDDGGNVYFTGSLGPQSSQFYGFNDATNRPFTSRAASSNTVFVASLDSNLNYNWVNTPSGAPPQFNFTLATPKVAWNTVLQRLFWVGYFGNGTLSMGNTNSVKNLNGPAGFLAVLDPSGPFTERVNLTVLSDYGVSGSQIMPFGGPSLNTNSVTSDVNTQPVIKGVQVTATVPNYLYRDLTNGDITFGSGSASANGTAIDALAETRIGCTGYSVGENVANGTANNYTFTINSDTVVRFNWLVEHALHINADFSATAGTDSSTAIGHIIGLSQNQDQAAGNPVPAVQKHWISENDVVIASIDGFSDDQNYVSQGLPVRYTVTGYNAFGPANTLGTNGTTTFIPFNGVSQRYQVPQFIMSGPASITYMWKLKIGMQINTSGFTSANYPRIHVVSDPGGVTNVTQADGVGSGVFYFDENTSIQVGSLKNHDVTQLKGWLNGDGTVFTSSGDLTNIPNAFTNGGNVYSAFNITQVKRPGRLMWNYGDRIFEEYVTIGNPVTFATVDDPLVKAKLVSTAPPASIDITTAPQGSATSDMGVWDDQGKKFYPLRPGTILTYWNTTGDPAERVIVRLYISYPDSPHYRHIANTPPVSLDPSTNDLVSFNALKYTEPTTGAVVDSDGNFAATGPGKTVLLFNSTSSSGRGGTITTLRVRVVQSRNWSDQLPGTQTAVIGQTITSSYDTAGLGTGYLYFPGARYNADVYDRTAIKGPIIPVNLNPTAGQSDQLVVVWYEKRDTILWPYQAQMYQPAWPTTNNGLNRIVIASRYGNESVAQDGTDQIITPATTVGTNLIPATTMFDPVRFQQLKIYNQPDSTLPGFNPNEEHALLAPSLRNAAVSPRPMAVYALRDNDLNQTNHDSTYTSDPYVLVQFLDALDGQYKMRVYNVIRGATNLNAGDLSYTYSFQQEMNAGEPVIPFYPLSSVIGATPCSGTYGRDGNPSAQLCFWKDHKGTAWAVSGDSYFYTYFLYPLSPDFWWPAQDAKQPGDCVVFLPNTKGYSLDHFNNIDYTRNDQTPNSQGILYTTQWPDNVPILKVGETLTFPGGEYHSDNPVTTVLTDTGDVQIQDTPGLPGVLAFAAGQIVYDTMNPVMDDVNAFDHYTARLFPALEQRTVTLAISDLPVQLQPANKRTTVNSKGEYVFVELPASLQKRIFYNPISGVLGIRGFLNDKDISDSTLTASPGASYVLEPNILTTAEKGILDGSASTSPFIDLAGTTFATAMDSLFDLSRNPNALDRANTGSPDQAYRVGLEQKVSVDSSTGVPNTTTNSGVITVNRIASHAQNEQALGPGLALAANAAFLSPTNTTQISYVTVAENNSDALGGSPVILHIIKVDKSQRYRGNIHVVLSDNVFDENIVLRHTGDFGGNPDDLVFEWWYRPEDGTTALPPDRQGAPTPWKLFADPSGNQGLGFSQLTLKGNPSAPEVLLADTLFFVRYRHKDEVTDGINWEVPQPNGERRCVLNNCGPGIPYDWAGAANSSPRDVDGDGQPDYLPQLAEGWIKRVLDRVNPYEARINDFSSDAPASYSSIIRELGARYEGAVALNPDKNVIENVGLIALYQTILNRGRSLSIDLSTPISTPAIANALELVSSRLADFYTLLGNDAYSDSLNPTIGYGSTNITYGDLAPSIFAFQDQVSSLLEEELALLRGQDAFAAAPVYNRLFWNFTHAEGEAAYAMKYDISDVNADGFIDVNDAQILYPQGHGDAWGHYLTALGYQYDLLRNSYFNWVSRSEFLNINDVVLSVDYLDERKFAQIAAAKAQAGADIVNLTYREKYVADPAGQWQGYTDTDAIRAWGVEEWSRRAGQGTYFDWVTANSLLPAVHPNTNYTGIQKVDRTTVQDIAQVAANLVGIQTTMEQVNKGNNPLGLAAGALTFDIDPTFLTVGSQTVQGQQLFDQVYARAVGALNNAKATFDNANRANNMIRQIADNTAAFQTQVQQQDLSYRNQLIEIYGTPYAGTIGSGQAYPAGYQGPDTMLYMYVPVNNLNDSTVPQANSGYYQNYIDEITGPNATFINGSGLIPGFPNAWVSRYNLTFQLQANITNSINYTDFTDPNNLPGNNNLDNITLPIMASGYTFVAPSTWGIRSSPGELQTMVSQLLQAQADVDTAMYNWDNTQGAYIQELQLINTKFDYNKKIRDLMKGKIATDTALDAVSLALKTAARVSSAADDAIEKAATAAADFIPSDLLIAGLADGPGDVLAPVRGAIEEIGVVGKVAADGALISFETAADVVDFGKNIGDAIFDLEQDADERDLDMIESLQSLQNDQSNESGVRIDVFNKIQRLQQLSDQYRALLAKGQQLVEVRTAFNKRVAVQAQMNRYQDMTFRVSRNAALEQYRSAFDLAARYCYLAATAYDYDTNLRGTDAGSPRDLMTDIIRQRTIGLVVGGVPQVGASGLAEDLAKLSANYAVLKTSLGLNNPQIESATFSLRQESFRILNSTNSDTNWVQTLKSAAIYQPDLWQVAEFRQYCRPFTSATNGAQPGLVIPLSTTIRSGQNFFGWPLGGGDNSYNPTDYATRIASVGVWFPGYDAVNLPQTPRVYLVPAGQDVMTIPHDPDLSFRLWSVVDQTIPIPYPSVSASLNSPTFKPLTDSLNGSFGSIRQFSSFRAFGFDHGNLSPYELSTLTYDARLIGRSAWNTKWLLIIPGATLNADPAHGLDVFINSVKDIKLVMNTYGVSGN